MLPGISHIRSFIDSYKASRRLNEGIGIYVHKSEEAGYTTNYHGKKVRDPLTGLGSTLLTIRTRKDGDLIYLQVEADSRYHIGFFTWFTMLKKKSEENPRAMILFTGSRFDPKHATQDQYEGIKRLEKDNIFLVEGADVDRLNQVLDQVLFD